MLYYRDKFFNQALDEEKNIITRYEKGNLLGEGSFGKVYEGFDKDQGNIFAIKEIDLKKINIKDKNISNKINSFELEIQILKNLSHKNIIKYFGTRKNEETFHIFLELCVGGSIQKMIDEYNCLNESLIKKFTRETLYGLEYLHANNVIHRGK